MEDCKLLNSALNWNKLVAKGIVNDKFNSCRLCGKIEACTKLLIEEVLEERTPDFHIFTELELKELDTLISETR